jgi:hypothetical protein
VQQALAGLEARRQLRLLWVGGLARGLADDVRQGLVGRRIVDEERLDLGTQGGITAARVGKPRIAIGPRAFDGPVEDFPNPPPTPVDRAPSPRAGSYVRCGTRPRGPATRHVLLGVGRWDHFATHRILVRTKMRHIVKWSLHEPAPIAPRLGLRLQGRR